jgi:hypothetical protein
MRRALVIVCALAGLTGIGEAQESSVEEERFFIDKEDDREDETLWQGSLTSTTFYFRESGGTGSPLITDGATPDNASPFSRLFTELRAQLDGRHVRGGRWDLRLDGRARFVKDPFGTNHPASDENNIQSGAFGDNEYDVREFYLVRGGRRTDLFLGRQVIGDLAAIKIDGLRFDYAKNARWTYLGFLGAYPLRGSRSIATDYPRGVGPMGQRAARVVPVAGGFGGAFRTSRSYGALGAVAIIPTKKDAYTGTLEKPRVFVTTNGYARRSPKLDLYHYVVVDLLGEAGFALTNLTVGMQWKPTSRLRTNLSVNRVDTEVLNQQVRDQLENVEPLEGVVINNNQVQRVAADSVRATVSGAFGKVNRFEVTTGLSARRRPEVRLESGTMDQTLPAAQAVDLLLQVVDRRFYGGTRLDLSFVRGVGIGSASYARSTSQIIRLGATKEMKDGKSELQADVAYISSADDNAGGLCITNDISTCYGSANSSGLQGTAVYYRRLKKDWFFTGSGSLGTQKLTTTGTMGEGVPQTTTVNTSLFLRLGYRF